MKLRELRILLAVVKAGSMAKGATELAISQPNVSKAISDLEHALGVRLLDRSARGIEPTIYGDALLTRGVAAPLLPWHDSVADVSKAVRRERLRPELPTQADSAAEFAIPQPPPIPRQPRNRRAVRQGDGSTTRFLVDLTCQERIRVGGDPLQLFL